MPLAITCIAAVSGLNAMTFYYADLFLTLSDEKDAIIEAEHFIVTDIKQVICWRGGSYSHYGHKLVSSV